MEVAGQWRREWAGTAEYGKVTEGGVTRRVARAVEVMNASTAGTRVRVMRAAYHSTAGSGAPAATFMLHSSRRVISSGSNLLDSPTFMTKPLEISSVPFESSPDRFSETDNYEVTEPDDLDISEPSKWRGSTSRGASLRTPSEESSSADTASVIDLDHKINTTKYSNTSRKYSLDSENSDIPSHKRTTTRASPLLDAPTTLSTLKYKSLLNGHSSGWNDRRKSYSFENTSPLSESIMHSNDTLAMESSTDSGICKSSELVNEIDETSPSDRQTDENDKPKEGSFRDWLAKNRSGNLPTPKSQTRNIYEDAQDKITVQSSRKVSITIPTNNQIDDKFQYFKSHSNDDADRKMKKVGFSKTELHFAAETGTVNIIATDDKPPPSNDFRKRRSAFVPMKGHFEKPITLFGDKTVDSIPDDYATVEITELEENASSTRSILKNKIPKPKPYHLGANSLIGEERHEFKDETTKKEYIIPTVYEDAADVEFESDYKSDNYRNNSGTSDYTSRAKNTGSHIDNITFNDSNHITDFHLRENSMNVTRNIVKDNLSKLQQSPVPHMRSKTRPLRESDLTYFGVGSTTFNKNQRTQPSTESYHRKDNNLKSVQLIKEISNSLGNSEAESEDPEYQNFPLKTNFAPIPAPRTRTKLEENNAVQHTDVQETRRSRTSRHNSDSKSYKNRSISEPPKYRLSDISNVITKDTSANSSAIVSPQRDAAAVKQRYSETKTTNNNEDTPLYENIQETVESQKKHVPVPHKRLHRPNKSDYSKNPIVKEITIEIEDHAKSTRQGSNDRQNSKNHRKATVEKQNHERDGNVDNIAKTTCREKHSRDSLEVKGKDKQLNKDEHGIISSRKSEKRTSSSKAKDKAEYRPYSQSSTLKMSDVNSNKEIYMEKPQRRDRSKSKDKTLNGTSKSDTNKNRSSKKGSENVASNRNGTSGTGKYVINYDDKNGTVSSVCKINSSLANKKSNHRDRSKVSHEHRSHARTKSPEKRSLRK